MQMTAEQYFKREMIKSAQQAKRAIQDVVDLPKSLVKAEMHKINDKIHKSKYPVVHAHLKKCINGGGSLKHASSSKAAAKILASREMKAFAKKNVNTCFKTRLLFKSDPDLARAFYEATISGEISQSGKKIIIKATMVDKFDFRFDLWPKDLSLQGIKLRYSGNAAYIAQEMGLLKPVKISVDLAGPI